MGLMDAFKGIFGSTQDTQTQQSGASNTSTQNNAWNNADLQGLFSRLFGGTQSNVPINQYQTGAADQLAGAGQYAMPAFNAASNVAGTGITTDSINKYMTPYTQNVVDATQNQFNQMNARTLAGQQASRAKAGALTGTQGNVGRAFSEMQLATAQNPIIAGLYQQGYNSAVDTAAKDASLRTQAAGTTGSILGAYTGAGNAAYNAGQGIFGSNFQNAMLPYQQQASFLPAYLQAAGTNSSTNSTGTTNSSTTKTDSPFDVGMDLLGGAMSLGMFSDERVKHDIKPVGKTFDGMPIYTFKYNGDESGRTHMGLMAQDVEQEKPHAVGSFQGVKTVDYDKATRASGGGVGGSKHKEFHEKVTDAFKAITEMKRSMGGGVMPRHGYATDGFVEPVANDPGVNYDSNWTPVVETAPQTSGFQDWLKGRSDARAQNKGQGSDMSGAIANNEKMMSSFMSGMTPRANGGYIPQGHRDGNPVWSSEGALDFGSDESAAPMYAGVRNVPPSPQIGRPYTAPAEERAPESGGFFSGLSSFLPSVKREGVITGDKITPDQSVGAIISGMGRGRYRDSVLALSNNRFKELEAEREAGRLLGTYQGQPTMDKQRLGLERGKALGVIDGFDTVEGRRQSEDEYKSRLPQWQKETGEYDQFGRPIPGIWNPYNATEDQAPPPNYRVPGRTMPNPQTAYPPGMSRAPGSNAPSSDVQPQGRPSVQPQPAPTGTPGTSDQNPVYVPNVAAETELIKTSPGTYYRTWDNRVKRTPDDPSAPERSTSPPPSARVSAPGQPPAAPQALPGAAPQPPAAAPAAEALPQAPQQQPVNPATPTNTPGMRRIGTTTSTMNPNLRGSEALNQLPPLMQTKVLQALDGRIPPPTGMGLKDPHQQMILSAAQMVDPGFDMTAWARRHKMQLDYSPGGKIGNNLASASMVVNHLYDLKKAAEALNNNNLPLGNLLRGYVTNPLARNLDWESKGSDGKTVPKYADREQSFNTIKKLAIEELGKFLSGSGQGSLEQHRELMALMETSRSDGELQTAIKDAVKLIGGKMEPYAAAWNQNFNTQKTVRDLLSPEAQKHIDMIVAPKDGTAPVQIKGDDDYRKLPSGSRFIGPDNKERTKP